MNQLLEMMMQSFTRKQLRKLAILAGIKRGRNKEDTLKNILESDRIQAVIKLKLKP